MKNYYLKFGLIAKIYPRKNHASNEPFVVDTDDLPKIRSIKGTWFIRPNTSNGKLYVSTTIDGKQIALHRFILNAPDGMVVDHINGNPLDNRKSNLRVVTRSENQLNRQGPQKNSTSGYLGVHLTSDGKWVARCIVAGKENYLGVYLTKEEAADVVQRWRADNVSVSLDARRRRSS